VLAEALAIVHTTGERWGEAELYRLKGELLLLQATERGGPDKAPIDPLLVAEAEGGTTGRLPLRAEAEACFQQALTMARHQQAKSWELRAAMSLARLWQHQGKRADAYTLLAEVHGWFTEGFDTADLQEAKALLAELA
jgi:predicted ATPase